MRSGSVCGDESASRGEREVGVVAVVVVVMTAVGLIGSRQLKGSSLGEQSRTEIQVQ